MNNDFKYIDDRMATLMTNENMIDRTYFDKDQNKGRTHYVLWSGGTDSTLLLYELLGTYGSHNVVAISLKYPWLDERKWKSEQLHREAIKAKLALKGDRYKDFIHTEINITQQNISRRQLHLASQGTFAYPQAISWISIITVYMGNGSYLYTGGIRDDDLVIKRGEYHDLFVATARVLEKEITLREPYLYLTKPEILYKLFEYDLYDVTWFCEMPRDVNKICCLCNPCKTHLTALTVLTTPALNRRNIPELIRMKAQHALEEICNSEGYATAYKNGEGINPEDYQRLRVTNSEDKKVELTDDNKSD